MTPPTDPFERDRGRFARYQELRDFYAGVQWSGKPRRGETRMVANYARALVRKVVSYALPDPVGFSVPAPVLGESSVVSRQKLLTTYDSRAPSGHTTPQSRPRPIALKRS